MDRRRDRVLACETMLCHQTTVIAPGFQALLHEHHLDSVEAVYQCSAGDIITRSGSTEVRRITLGSGAQSETLFIKKYWVNKPSQLWRGMFRGTFFGCSKVRREYANLARLRDMGLDAPARVAFGEERKAGWLVRSYLISQGVPAPTTLHQFIRDQLPALCGEEARQARQALIENLALSTRRLHEHHFVHHDYFWRNILLNGLSLEHFFLIDAHKGRIWHSWSDGHARACDLASLDAPAPYFFRRAERLRFFLRYRNHRRLDDQDKALIRESLRLAAPMRENQLRRVMGSGAARQP